MANPQVENGHVDIANEIVEALARTRISGTEMQLFWVILRKTWGWHKKMDVISLSQFSEMTLIPKPHVIRYLKKLLHKKVIAIAQKGNDVVSYGINKNYDDWCPLPKKATLPKKAIIVAQNGNLALPKMVPTKENIIQKKIKEKTYGHLRESFEEFWKEYPKKKAKGDAMKAWMKLHPSAELVAEMKSKIILLKRTEEWLKDKGQFVPYPAKWLRNEGWHDEVKPKSTW